LPGLVAQASRAGESSRGNSAGIRSWIIPNLTTVIDSKRQMRGPDDSSIVPAGTAMGIETGDDSVILQVVTLREAGQAERR
jgi:hypothetical protein